MEGRRRGGQERRCQPYVQVLPPLRFVSLRYVSRGGCGLTRRYRRASSLEAKWDCFKINGVGECRVSSRNWKKVHAR